MIDGIEVATKISEILLSKVSDIDLVLLYGAFAQGRGHSRSDYDMIAIINNKEVEWEFVLNEQPICLWSMTWKNVEEVIAGKNGILWSVGVNSLVEAVIVYYKDEEILDNFNKLKDRALEGGKNALIQAIENFDSLYGLLWRLEKHMKEKNKYELTFLKWNIVTTLNCMISALNKKYFLNNWGKQFTEIAIFDILPVDYVSRSKKFLTAEPEDALEIASGLVDDVRTLIKDSLNSDKEEFNIQKVLSSWAGLIEYLNKSESAEEKKDLFAGLYAACDNAEYYLRIFQLLQNETWKKNCFYSVQESLLKLPEKIAYHIKKLLQSQNLTELKDSTAQLAKQLEEKLLSRNATLPIAESLDEGKKFIQVRTL